MLPMLFIGRFKTFSFRSLMKDCLLSNCVNSSITEGYVGTNDMRTMLI